MPKLPHPAPPARRPSRPGAGAFERPRWPPPFFFWTAAGLAAYLAVMRLATGENRVEQVVLCGALLVLAAYSDATRRFFKGLLPFLLFGISYDLTHITEPLVRYLHVHVEEPYRFDQRFFGIATAKGLLTPNEFFALHHWPLVDFITGTSYIIYVYWAIGFAAYLALFRRDEPGRVLLARFGWTFLVMNLAGFATYYLYPAAPPWYVADYGLGPAQMSAQASAAGAVRWDAITHLHYFAGFYGRSADVFGAIPSLHVSYPLLTFFYGRELRKRWLDVASFALFLTVSFAAVYLNHHYMLDVLLGVLYTLIAYGLESVLFRLRARARAASAPAK